MMMMKDDFPEDLITDILWRLPSCASTIVRFRCVSKSWRELLSDPSFIRTKLLPSADCSGHEIIITHCNSFNRPMFSSLHSADTLEPLLPSPVQQPFNPETVLDQEVVGCSNGLVCILDGEDLILWNPTTSGSKVLPPSPYYHAIYIQAIGFGFDPETNDYKIIRQPHHGPQNYLFEVYSLRNDSWRKLDDDHVGEEGYYCPDSTVPKIAQLNKGKLFWGPFGRDRNVLEFSSFDVSSEVFQRVVVSYPSATMDSLGHEPRCLLNEESMVAVIRGDDSNQASYWEIWVLMRYWVSESWTRLFVITTPPAMTKIRLIGFSRNLKCFFTSRYASESRFISVFRPETGEFRELEVEGKEVINYAPCQISAPDCYI